MQLARHYTDECKFCARYLRDNGVESSNFDELVALITDLDPDYKLIKIEKEDFFKTLATKMRDLWPAGEKDNKYPWRDSITNLARRLQLLWQIRELKNYSLDDCLSAARKYLAQFQDNTKYMKTLKYFILKQKSIVSQDGKINYVQESQFADILEGKSDLSQEVDEWFDVINVTDEGTLI